MIPPITFACALVALIIAILHGMGKGGRPPLWIAVAFLAIGVNASLARRHVNTVTRLQELLWWATFR